MSGRILTALCVALLAAGVTAADSQADGGGGASTGVTVSKPGIVDLHAYSGGSSGGPAQVSVGSQGPSYCPITGDPEFVVQCGVRTGAPNCPISVTTGAITVCDANHSWPPAPPPNPVTPQQLAQEAASRITFALPSASTSPPPDKLVVNLPTWLWVDPSAWHTLTATASAGPVTATATAEPARVVWTMGDGNAVICFDPGRPWTSSLPSNATSNCSYAYTANSYARPGGTFTVTTTIYWHVTWLSVGAPGGGDFGLVPGQSTTTTVRVGEIHAINVYPPSS